MRPSIRVVDEVGKEVHHALTELLGLEDFNVVGYEIHEHEAMLILFCVVKHDAAICPNCHRISVTPHEYKRRVKRDLPAFGLQCYLEYDHRRFKCVYCGKPFTEVLNGVPFKGRNTARYENHVFEQYRHSAITEVVRREGLGYKAAQGIFYRQVKRRISQAKGGCVRRLGIDEISLKKGHQHFALIVSDLDRGCVIDVLEDPHMERLEAWFDRLSPAERQGIEEVSMDMWSPYRSAVEHKLPRAQIVADRFHVAQNLNRAVTKARRDIQRDAAPEIKERLKGRRWVLVKNEANLSAKEQAKLADLYDASPELKQLHLLKEAFRDIFETDQARDQAAQALVTWIEKVRATDHKFLDNFLKTFDNWGDHILNYFNQRTTQGFVEGMNNKIKLIKRRGYGYRNFDQFSQRILIECGLVP
jgi:transposase